MYKIKCLLRTFLVSAIIAFSVQVEAQVKFGVKAGLNMNNINQNYKVSAYESGTKIRLAYNIGATIDWALTDVFSFQSGLMFTSKGYSYDFKNPNGIDDYYANLEGYDKVIINYLEVPVNFTYKIDDFQIYAGPYLAYGIGGKNKWDYTHIAGSDLGVTKYKPVFKSVDDVELNDEEKAYFGLDYGLNFGIGYQVGPILFNAGYSLGLGNITAEYDEEYRKDFQESNRVISLSASYFFAD